VEKTLSALELISNNPAPLLSVTSKLRATLAQVKSSPKPLDIDIDAIQLPPNVGWKLVKVPAIKHTTVSKAPRVMAIHLVRSVYERGYGAGRNGCEVNFEEELSIPIGGDAAELRKEEEAISDDDEDVSEYNERYRLMSVVTHKGGHDNGHYICYRRRKRVRKSHRQLSHRTDSVVNGQIKDDVIHDVEETPEDKPYNQVTVDKGYESDGANGLGFEDDVPIEQPDSRTKWWEISDEVVNGVNRTDVLSKRKGVYILFYERI
jgi:Ubiquitin carboxyl-terminal hydrolase